MIRHYLRGLACVTLGVVATFIFTWWQAFGFARQEFDPDLYPYWYDTYYIVPTWPFTLSVFAVSWLVSATSFSLIFFAMRRTERFRR